MPSILNKTKNRNYKVRNFLTLSLTCSYLCMLVISMIGTMVILQLLLNGHLKQILKFSSVKNNHIRSKTIAELTQNTMTNEGSNVEGVARVLT